MKATAKKAKASHKRELYRTGGGPLPEEATISDLDEQVLALLAGSIDPVPNRFDDDASYHADEVEDEADEIVDVAKLGQSTSGAVNENMFAPADQPVTSQSKRKQNYEELMVMERKEHEMRIQYWEWKVQFLKEEHEAKMKKLSADLSKRLQTFQIFFLQFDQFFNKSLQLELNCFDFLQFGS